MEHNYIYRTSTSYIVNNICLAIKCLCGMAVPCKIQVLLWQRFMVTKLIICNELQVHSKINHAFIFFFPKPHHCHYCISRLKCFYNFCDLWLYCWFFHEHFSIHTAFVQRSKFTFCRIFCIQHRQSPKSWSFHLP